MKPQVVHCFCDDDHVGNPAAVVCDFEGDDVEKQSFAKQLNLPVTVFVVNPNATKPMLEYFYPNSQMPLCLHGTLGAAAILSRLSKWNKKECQTKSGHFLQWMYQGENFQIKVIQQSVHDVPINPNEIEEMLGLKSSDISTGLPYKVASVGSPKLLVPLNSPKILEMLRPNFEQISRWSQAKGVNGVYAYVLLNTNAAESVISARGFNPRTGHDEDAATGVAVAALAGCLQHNLIVEQGRFVQKASRIIVTYKNQNEIWVGGKVRMD